jgi:hypothetical protein
MHEITQASLAEDPKTKFHCVCCDKVLKNHATIQWVEMTESGVYYKTTSTLPEGEVSQGCFPMGSACYRKAKPI